MTIPHPSGEKHYSRQHPEWVLRGPDAPGAKLKPDEIAALREELEEPGANKTHLAKKYGVSRITVWRHARAVE